MRLDQLLSARFADHSRSYFQYLIEEGFVLLNGHPVKKRMQPKEGDQIEVLFQPSKELDVKPEAIPLDILFEDEHLIAVNKPANMVVHPAPGNPFGTFANALLHHCKEIQTQEYELLRPGIVHRLDKDTSGVLIAAKNLAAHQKLSEQFANRTVGKRYLAICTSVPPEGDFSARIKRHPIKRKEMTINPEGKEAHSHFHVLARRGGLSLVEIQIFTGRTHQVRVHLKGVNCPVLGDAVYGSLSLNRKYGAKRQLLHASSLTFTHPFSSISMELNCPPPPDMKNFIDMIKLS